jgi:hypothetical protein
MAAKVAGRVGVSRRLNSHDIRCKAVAKFEMDVLQQIVGEQLSGVTFVMDYVQLQFNPPPIVSVFTPITVINTNGTCRSGEDQFRNRLCEQITKIVKAVRVQEGDSMVVEFEDGSLIAISLKETDYRGPEAFEFHGRNREWMVV